MQTPKVSVIVPVYNVEKYLPECIDSILAQTFTDFEILLIDDGSPDNSGAICDEYAKKDSRIHVFHKPNGGVSSARNLGIDKVQGEWITFVDSDDTIPKDSLKKAIKEISSNDLDLLYVMHTQTVIYPSNVNFYNRVLSQSEYAALQHPVCIGGGFFKAEIIHNNSLRFPREIKYGEDQIFVYEFIRHSGRLMYCNSVLYNYRINDNSATHQMKSSEILTSLEVLTRYKKYNVSSKQKLDGVILDMFFCRELFNFYSIKKLLNVYSNLEVGPNITINSGSTKLFYLLSKVCILCGVVFGILYFKIGKNNA